VNAVCAHEVSMVCAHGMSVVEAEVVEAEQEGVPLTDRLVFKLMGSCLT